MFKSLEVQLIAQVKKHKEIWYYTRVQPASKLRIWNQIGEVLGISAVTAKCRWKSIKCRYMRLRNTENPSQKWPLFNYLSFLDEVYPKKPPIENPNLEAISAPPVVFKSHLEPIPEHSQEIFVDCEKFGQLVASKLRRLETDDDRVIMKERILQVFSVPTEDDNMDNELNIVFVE